MYSRSVRVLKMIVLARSSHKAMQSPGEGWGGRKAESDPRDANEQEEMKSGSRNTGGRLSVAGVHGIINPKRRVELEMRMRARLSRRLSVEAECCATKTGTIRFNRTWCQIHCGCRFFKFRIFEFWFSRFNVFWWINLPAIRWTFADSTNPAFESNRQLILIFTKLPLLIY